MTKNKASYRLLARAFGQLEYSAKQQFSNLNIKCNKGELSFSEESNLSTLEFQFSHTYVRNSVLLLDQSVNFLSCVLSDNQKNSASTNSNKQSSYQNLNQNYGRKRTYQQSQSENNVPPVKKYGSQKFVKPPTTQVDHYKQKGKSSVENVRSISMKQKNVGIQASNAITAGTLDTKRQAALFRLIKNKRVSILNVLILDLIPHF